MSHRRKSQFSIHRSATFRAEESRSFSRIALGVGFVEVDDPRNIGIYFHGAVGNLTGGFGLTLHLDKDFETRLREDLAKAGVKLVKISRGKRPNMTSGRNGLASRIS